MKKHHGQRSHQRRPTKPSTTYNTVPPRPPPPISMLPPELHLKISFYLVSYDELALRLTSRYFSSILPRLDVKLPLCEENLQDIDRSFYVRNNDFWACSNCKQLKARYEYWDPTSLRRGTWETRKCNKCEPDFINLCGHCASSDSSDDDPRILRRYL